jgi:hypothetical protein
MFSPASSQGYSPLPTGNFGRTDSGNKTSGRDRTQDFLNAISQTRKAQTPSKALTSGNKPPNEKSIFAVVASQLGKDLTEVTIKLERLTQRIILEFG